MLFLETIKINNGRRINLDGHNSRMNYTRNRHFHEIMNIDLKDEIIVPEDFKSGIVKCRVIYGRKIEKIEFEPYIFKNPRIFQVVDADHVVYPFKSKNRKILTDLYIQKGIAHDIILVKNNLITDSYYANLAFSINDKWYTPKKPLLMGTQRTKLIQMGKISEIDIPIDELFKYESLKIFNAITEWGMHAPIHINSKNILFSASNKTI